MAITAADIRVKFSSDGAEDVKKDINGVGGAVDNIQSKLSGWGKNLRKTGAWLSAGVTTPLVAFFTKAINGASSLEQAQGKVDAVFENSAKVIKAWSKTTADSIGVSETQALQWTGTIGNFFTSAGIAHDQAAQMSQDFITLSADMAAFNDVSAARASDALVSGLAGEYDALQRLGINIKAATVEEEALAIAMADGREEITENDRALARYNVIMRESANQHGQFKREATGFAGQLAILKAQFSELVTEIGGHLIPHATAFIGVLRRLVASIDALSPSMQRWAVVAGLVAAALGPLLIAIGFMLPGLGVMIGLFAAMVSPIGLVVAAVTALAVAFRGPLMSGLRRVGNVVKDAIDAFRDMWDSLSGVTEIVETSEGFYATWTRTVEVATGAVNTFSRFLYSLSAALASIGGDNTPAWIAAMSRGLIDLAVTVEELVGHFSDLRERGLDPVQAALVAVGLTFEPLYNLMTQAAAVVRDLSGAFQAFSDGNFSEGFQMLGSAAETAWAVIREGIGLLGTALVNAAWSAFQAIAGAVASVDWSGVASEIRGWADALATIPVIGWLVAGVLDGIALSINILQIAVTIAQSVWNTFLAALEAVGLKSSEAEEQINGVIDALNRVTGASGEAEDNMSDLRDAISGLPPIAQELGRAFIAAWTAAAVLGVTIRVLIAPFRMLLNIFTSLTGPLMTVIGALARLHPVLLIITTAIAAGLVTWRALEENWGGLYDKSVPLYDALQRIANQMVLLGVVVGIASGAAWDAIASGITSIAIAADKLLTSLDAALLKLVQFGVTVGIVAMAAWGKIESGINSVKNAVDAVVAPVQNAIDAFQDLYDIVTSLGSISLPSWLGGGGDTEAKAPEAPEAPTEPVLTPELSATKTNAGLWNILEAFPELLKGLKDVQTEAAATDVAVEQMGQRFADVSAAAGEFGTRVAWLAGQVADPFQNLPPLVEGGMQRVVGAIVGGAAQVTSTLESSGAQWGATLQAGVAPLGTIAATAFGMVASSATAQFGMATASIAANNAAMLANTMTSFTSIRTTATTNTTAMQAGVTAGMNAMRATSTAAVAGMQAGIAASMLVMRSSAVSSANAMQSSVVAAMTNMALRSAAAVRSGMGQIPGIIASVGGAAAGVAFGVGAAIGNGVAAGMLSALGTIRAAANAMISEALRAAQARAIIASPSKLFEREVGVHISEGVAEGIERASGVVQRAVSDMLDVNGLLDRLVYLVNDEIIGAVRNSIPEAGTFSNPYTIGLPGTAGRRYPTQFDNRVIFEAGSIVQREGESTPELAERIATVIAKMQNRDLETVIGGSMV